MTISIRSIAQKPVVPVSNATVARLCEEGAYVLAIALVRGGK